MPLFYGSRYANAPHHVPRPRRAAGGFRKRRSPAELAALKARTRCDHCRQKWHWCQECPNRKQSLTDAVRARTREKTAPTRLWPRYCVI